MRRNRLGKTDVHVTELGFGGGPLGGLFAPLDDETAAGALEAAWDLPDGVTAYLCGPLPFMRAVRGDLLGLGLPAHAVHYEVFGPDLWLGTE